MFDSSASTDNDNVFSFIEMDNPTAHRKPAPELETDVIELDLAPSRGETTRCLQCKIDGVAVDEQSICQSCRNLVPHAVANTIAETQDDIVPEFGSDPPADSLAALAADLNQASALATANAAVVGAAAADGGGRLPGVGFRTQDGYIAAINNGVPAHTHAEYVAVLKNRFKLSSTAIAKLNLAPPIKPTVLPEGKGIKHVPTGPSIFDKPKDERAFVVGPASAAVQTKLEKQKQVEATVGKFKSELIAGAVAEGHHAIVAWEGTSGMQRSELEAALKGISREAWTPGAPNARAQAGSAIAALGRGGLHVKPLRKGSVADSGLASGEHTWTVGRVSHTGKVGDEYGEVIVRFKLSGTTLTYEGDATIAEPVVATFAARMAAEQFKSSDVTGWLSRTIRWKLDGVRFGALGWLVPAANVGAAAELCKAVQSAGFGSGWVTGLPVATSDQLRDGIVRSLIDEVSELIDRLNKERNEVKASKDAAVAAARAKKNHGDELQQALKMAEDVGEKRAHTYLKEFRAIGERVVAYGAVLGEERVDSARQWVKRGISELETIVGEDFTGIRERFGLIWEEIERDRKASGGVL